MSKCGCELIAKLDALVNAPTEKRCEDFLVWSLFLYSDTVVHNLNSITYQLSKPKEEEKE